MSAQLTYFASPERDTVEEIAEEHQALSEIRLVQQLLNRSPGPNVVPLQPALGNRFLPSKTQAIASVISSQ
jgi:hypothetical protein